MYNFTKNTFIFLFLFLGLSQNYLFCEELNDMKKDVIENATQVKDDFEKQYSLVHFGVIDENRVVLNSTLFKNIVDQMESLKGKLQTEINNKGNSLKLKKSELDTKAKITNMSPEDYKKAEEELQKAGMTVSQDAQEMGHKLETAYKDAMNFLLEQITNISASLIEKHKIKYFIMKKSDIIVANNVWIIDLTDEVLEALNKDFKSYDIKLS